MPVTVMAWNVQNFGAAGPSSQLAKGRNSAILAQFIGAVAHAYQVDVLALMEVQQNARLSLNTTLHALNAATGTLSWCYDWIPAALEITGQPPVEASVTTPLDLSWASGLSAPRREGYAVFWRNDGGAVAGTFRMLRAQRDISLGARRAPTYNPGYMPGHAISLNLTARTTVTTHSGIRFAPQAPFDPANPDAAGSWEPSLYPEVSTGRSAGWELYWELVRRPAVVMLRVGGGTTRQSVWPVQVFHAPSVEALARRGIVMSALGQENYAVRAIDGNHRPAGALTDVDKATGTGDYNLNPDGQSPGPWNKTYSYWWRTFANNGAGMDTVLNEWNDSRATEVKLVNWHNGAPDPNDPILLPGVGSYYSRPIDNVMVRALGGTIDSPRLLQAVMTGGALAGAPVQAYLPRLVRAENMAGAINASRGPLRFGHPLFPDIWNYTRFRAGVQQGFFDGADWNQGTGGARSAAQFIRTFVSDHLPLTARHP